LHAIAPLVGCFAVSAALAQTPAEPVPISFLDDIIVTATRIDQEVFSVPFTANVVKREDFLDRRSVRTISEALDETPGVTIQKTSYGQSSPFIRGFTGFRTLMLVDGIRLNNAVFREGPNQYFGTIDVLTVDRLDLVKGPSSVLYGSDAIGGTVNVITRTPVLDHVTPDVLSEGPDGTTHATSEDAGRSFEFHPGAYYRHAFAEDSHTGRGELSFSWNPRVAMLVGVTYRDFDDLRGGEDIGLQPYTGYSEIDGDVKLLFRPHADLDITAAFQRVEQDDVPRTHSTIFSKSFAGTVVGKDLRRELDQLRELAYVQFAWREVAPWLDDAWLSLSLHNQEEIQDRTRSSGAREITDFQDAQSGVLLSLESRSPIGTLSYGVEYYHDEVDSGGRDYNAAGDLTRIRPRGGVADDASYDLLGVYWQDQFRPSKPLEVTVGVRYSYAQARADKVDPNPADAVDFGPLDESFDAFSASLRARLDVTRNWNFFGGVSQGFRAPNLSDFTSFELARSGERETPAPNLDPEQYVSFEIGTKARIEPGRGSFYAAFFHTLIDDQIVRFPTGRLINGEPEVTRANSGDGYMQGIEIGADWNFYRGFTLLGNLTWTEGEVDTIVGLDTHREPISNMPPLTGLVGLRWESDYKRFWYEAVAQLARRQDQLSPGDIANNERIPPGGTPGYDVYTLRAGWHVAPQWRLTAAVENISDEDYRIHGSGSNEPGTNVVLSARFGF
jgi:hemoglobin/transferrin/lactoferrin receptor protein